jgi:hypothetical protein
MPTDALVLLRALRSLLPDAAQTRVLRACLCGGDAAGLPPEWIGGRLAPLLNAATGPHVPDRAARAFLKAAAVHEELRAREYLRVCEIVFSALPVPFLVLKGAALGESIYGNQALRHSHDIDLLVREQDRSSAARALLAAGFVLRAGELVHPCGLPVRVETRLFQPDYYRSDFDPLLERGATASVAGCAVRVLSPADSLLLACGHASWSPRRSTLQWACDAWMITHRSTVDWDVLVGAAEVSRLTAPLGVMLSYVRAELDARIPEDVPDRLARLPVPAQARDLALFGACHGGRRRSFEAAGDWPAQLRLLYWILFPSPEYARQACGARSETPLPLVYLMRPARYLYARARSMLRRTRDRASAATSSAARLPPRAPRENRAELPGSSIGNP